LARVYEFRTTDMINVSVIDNTKGIEFCLAKTSASVTYFSDEIKAFNVIEQEQRSVILLNYSLLAEGTAEYIQLILARSLNSKVVIIGDDLSEGEILECLIAGAKGYQDEKALSEYSEKLIGVIDAGEAWITRRMVSTLLDVLRG